MKIFFSYLPVFLLVFLWALYGPILRFFEGMNLNVFDVNFLGFFGGTAALFVIFGLQKTGFSFPSKSEVKKIVFYAASLSSTNLFLFFAFNGTTLANTILLHYTALFWAAIAAVFLFNEKFTKWKILSIGLSIAGILIIFLPEMSFSGENFWGNFFALLSSFGYAGIILASRSLKESEPKKMAFYVTASCAVIFLPLFVLLGSVYTAYQFEVALSYGAIYASLESVLLIYGMIGTSIIAASLILVLEIPVTALIGAFFYSEGISLNTVAGGALITAGVIILVLKERAGKA